MPDSGEPMGPVISPLNAEDSARLVSLAHRALAERGVEVVHDGRGTLRGAGAETYGLDNLAAQCARLPREQWANLVDGHMRTMVQSHQTPSPDSLDEVRERVYLRIRETASLPIEVDYGAEVFPGLRPLVAIDHPEHVQELLYASALAPLGGLGTLETLARENLRALPMPEHVAVDASQDKTGAADSRIHVFHTEDFFGASRYFVLSEVLDRAGVPAPAHGVLLAFPNRHVLVVHVLSGPGVVGALNGMVNLAYKQFQDQPGAISPFIYYLSADGQGQQVSFIQDDALVVRVEGRIEDAFRDLGLVG